MSSQPEQWERVRVEAFDEFFGAQYSRVVRVIAVATGDRAQAEDAAQEAFARAFERWEQVQVMERPAGWVTVVAMNHMRDGQRRQRRPWPTPAVTVADPAGAVVTAVAVRSAIAELPARQREAVVLRYLADLDVVEIAQSMRCAEGTVKATLHAARIALRMEMVDDDSGEVNR